MNFRGVFQLIFIFLVALGILTGCGDSSNHERDTSAITQEPNSSEGNVTSHEEENQTSVKKSKGYLIDSAVEGVNYLCAEGIEGLTDEEGMFECKEAPVVFKIGNLRLGRVQKFTSDGKVYLQDLLGLKRGTYSDSGLKLLARFIQSLDDDGEIQTKITIVKEIRDFLSEEENFKDLSEREVATLLNDMGKEFVSECEALKHLGDKGLECEEIDVANDYVDYSDRTAPIITLNGESNVTISKDGTYIELNTTAVDNVDGTLSVTISGTVDSSSVGVYTITYTSTDSSNNSATKVRTVNIIEKVIETNLTLESNTTKLNLNQIALLTLKNGETQEVTSNIEWVVTPSDRAEIINNIVTAKKEGNVTIEAKYQGKISNKLSFDVHWVINGHMLPPEPDEAENNATILGVDVNNNEVRDDVERWIYSHYEEPLAREILLQTATTYQKLFASPNEAHTISQIMDDTLACEFYLIDNNSKFDEKYGYSINKDMDKIVFNTHERHMAYYRYNAAFSGEVFGAPKEDKSKCNFDVDALIGGD